MYPEKVVGNIYKKNVNISEVEEEIQDRRAQNNSAYRTSYNI